MVVGTDAILSYLARSLCCDVLVEEDVFVNEAGNSRKPVQAQRRQSQCDVKLETNNN